MRADFSRGICEMCKVEVEGLQWVRLAGVPTLLCGECLEMELILIPDLVQVEDNDRAPSPGQMSLLEAR